MSYCNALRNINALERVMRIMGASPTSFCVRGQDDQIQVSVSQLIGVRNVAKNMSFPRKRKSNKAKVYGCPLARAGHFADLPLIKCAILKSSLRWLRVRPYLIIEGRQGFFSSPWPVMV